MQPVSAVTIGPAPQALQTIREVVAGGRIVANARDVHTTDVAERLNITSSDHHGLSMVRPDCDSGLEDHIRSGLPT